MISYSCIKDTFDFLFAIILLFVLWPVMLLAAILIKFEDFQGKVFYTQDRVGKGNKTFKLYKFRSMLTKTKENDRLLTDTERMLKIGLFLRKSSIDELPQIFNILKREMSFIGPRPLPVIYLPYYNKEEIRRHEVKPGISGLAQISGRNKLNWETKFKLDIEYVDNISFLLDMKIMYLTIKKIFSKTDIITRGEGPEIDFNISRTNQYIDNIVAKGKSNV